MFNSVLNLFGKGESYYFVQNPDTDPLPAEKQFGISLGQLICEQNDYYTDSLIISKKPKESKKILEKWWGITNTVTAHEALVRCIKDGNRHFYNNLVDFYIECDGKIKNLSPSQEYFEDIVEYFNNINEALQTDEGKKWFPNFRTDFLVKCDAWDACRVVFVSRTSYSLGYITESEAWDYINEAKTIARNSFTNWHDYAKSYLLSRAIWAGDEYEDYDEFAETADMLVNDEDSPWVEFGWIK